MTGSLAVQTDTFGYSSAYSISMGGAENAAVEKSARSKLQGWKMQEWNLPECFLVSTFAHICVCICTFLLCLLSVQNTGTNKLIQKLIEFFQRV